MQTKLIEMQDGALVEVEASAKDIRQAASGVADKVAESFASAIAPSLLRVCRPITTAWAELNNEMEVAQAEVELGLSFEGEGNLYVTKSIAGANLKIKLLLKPKREPAESNE